ncbi:hypothetical protein [Natrinema zhouii]|uniref:Uncharacterized protein n=1 Tax=Natrinema zhouii TaxID=1710539 RepID=A0A7D6GQ83_9EURY
MALPTVPTQAADRDADFSSERGDRILQLLLSTLRRIQAIRENGQLIRGFGFATWAGNAGGTGRHG